MKKKIIDRFQKLRPVINQLNDVEVDYTCPCCGNNELCEIDMRANFCRDCGIEFDWSKTKKCVECEFFHDLYKPIKGDGIGVYDAGRCKCEKHNLVCDYVSTQQLNKLVCIEEKNDGC